MFLIPQHDDSPTYSCWLIEIYTFNLTDLWRDSVVIQKFLSFICHSGLDPESSVCALDSRLRWNDSLGSDVKKCKIHYTRTGHEVDVVIDTGKKLSGSPLQASQTKTSR